MLQFADMDAVLEHKDVQKAIGERVELALKTPEKIEQVCLSAPAEMVNKNAFVKPLLDRPESREVVLSSMTEDELKGVLVKKTDLHAVALSSIELAQKTRDEFKPKAVAKLVELGVPEEKAKDIFAAADITVGDMNAVELSGRRFLASTGSQQGGKGKTTTDEGLPTGNDGGEKKAPVKTTRAFTTAG